MKIIGLRKINNLNPKECCGMKKRYIKLSVIFLIPVVVLALVLSGVATIVKAKSLIKYYDTVCQYNYEKIMSTIYNMNKSSNDFFDDDKMFCQYAKFLSDNRQELFSKLLEDGLMHYFSIYRNGEMFIDSLENIPIICKCYGENKENFHTYDRVLDLCKIMDEKTYDVFIDFYDDMYGPVYNTFCGKFDERYFYPEFMVFYFSCGINKNKFDSVREFIKMTYGDNVQCWHYKDEKKDSYVEVWDLELNYCRYDEIDNEYVISKEHTAENINKFRDGEYMGGNGADGNSEAYVFEFPEYDYKTVYGELKEIKLGDHGMFMIINDSYNIDDASVMGLYIFNEYNRLVTDTPKDNIKRYLTEDVDLLYDDVYINKLNEYVNIKSTYRMKGGLEDEYIISYYANPFKEAVKTLKKEYKIIIAISVAAYFLIEVLIYRKFKKEKEYEETTKKVYGAIAHELKTPLGVMKMYNEMIDSGELDKKTESEYRKIMDNQIDDMDKIIRTMIDCAKLEAGIVHLNIEEINFSELVNEIVSRQKYNLEKRKIKINIDIKDDIIVNGDLSGITYMVSNLLINAIKYTDAKEEISINVSEDDKWVMFLISNNVKPDMDSKMKQYKDGNIFKDVKKDGIGLLIVKGYAKLHKGEWGYENKEGICKFYFKLRKEFNG